MPKKIVERPKSPLHAQLIVTVRRKLGDDSIKAGMEKIGSSEQVYNSWQRGGSPRLDTLESIASGLEMSVPELLGGPRA